MPNNLRNAGQIFLIASLFVSLQSFASNDKKGLPDDKNLPTLFNNSSNAPVLKRVSDSIYDIISLGEYGLERDVFYTAYKGYRYLESKGSIRLKNLLTICDYSQSSNNKRLYVIDLLNGRLLYNTFVSHGRNSGDEYATSFSNFDNSNKSSQGFLVTGGTYSGKAGYSMHFDGMEAGINDKVRSRSIVLHGSRFVNENIMNVRGVIGKSLGCPAVPYGIHQKIINTIKGGSCFFINSPDQWYAHSSTILNSSFDINPSLINSNSTAQSPDFSALENTAFSAPVN